MSPAWDGNPRDLVGRHQAGACSPDHCPFHPESDPLADRMSEALQEAAEDLACNSVSVPTANPALVLDGIPRLTARDIVTICARVARTAGGTQNG